MAKKRKARGASPTKGKKKQERLTPISLHPLTFDDAMKRLLGKHVRKRGDEIG